MKTVTLKLYEYGELSDEAKANARSWYRSEFLEGMHVDVGEMMEYTVDDARSAAALLGIRIASRGRAGGPLPPNIYYDGLDVNDFLYFEGTYAYREDSIDKIREEYPKDEELNRIAIELRRLAAMYDCDATFCIGLHMRFHKQMTVDMQGWERRELADETQRQYIGEVLDLMDDFARWIHKRLRDEWDYQTSNDSIAERCAENAYMFTEDGGPWLED